MDDTNGGPDGGPGSPADLADQAGLLKEMGGELMEDGDLTAAAEILTRALILFLELERKDDAEDVERLLTRIVPAIGPFVYRDIRKAVEIEMGVRDPDPPEGGAG